MEDMMGDIIGTVKKSVAGLAGVAVCLITLGVVMEVLMGTGKLAFMNPEGVVAGITGIIDTLGTTGMTGLVAAVVVLGLLKGAKDA